MKCQNCKKKLNIMQFKCRCEDTFCINCRFPRHKCSFDYKTMERNRLMKDNVKITNIKIEKI